MGIMILKVPQDVPVEKEIIPLRKNITLARNTTSRFWLANPARYFPVYIIVVTSPMEKAKTSIIETEKSLFAPRNDVSVYSLNVMFLLPR